MGAFERNILQVIVLMLENRSFDHMLGFLKTPNGLTGNESNDGVVVSNDAAYAGDLNVDPSHKYEDVLDQLANGNSGFVANYREQPPTDNGEQPVAQNIMKCFAPDRLPALTTLARTFAIAERWFSSVPAQTWPNRFFVHAGTSMGQIDNIPRVYSARTIYDNLDAAAIEWAVYFHDMPQCLMLSSLRKQKYRRNFKIFAERFALDCATGRLPQYCFIEPRYFDFLSLKANDQHPPHDVALGDILIAEVYDALRNSGMWETSLFIVLWDEHGGIYDHMTPEATVNPDGLVHQNPTFDFKKLGVRIPAVLVSPYIAKGTVDTTIYDHASVLASVKKLFDLPEFLTQRDALANTFDHLIGDTLRTDTPTTLPRPTALTPKPPAFTSAALSPDAVAATIDQASREPLSEFQSSLVELAKTLDTNEGPRTRVARMAASPVDEHSAAVHVRQATNAFLNAGS